MSDASDLLVSKGRSPTEIAAAADPDPTKGGDVYKWAMEQAALIREGRHDEIDWINVADEIESVGKSEVRSLTSNLEVVLTHMIKWDYQPARRSRSWAASIDEHRARVEKDLLDNPSLKSKLSGAVGDGYRFARFVAARETGLDRKTFPAACPYDWDAIMTRPFDLDQAGETAP